MTFIHILQHAGVHIFTFLSLTDKLAFRTISRFFQAFHKQHETKLALPFQNGDQWRSIVGKFRHLQHLQAFPNTLPYLRSLSLHKLTTLNLSACGLTYVNIKPLGVIKTLGKLSNLHHLYLNNNPQLKTNGVARILRAVKRSGAVLESFYASNTGLRRVLPIDMPVLRRLKILNLSSNLISKGTARNLLASCTVLERLFIDTEGLEKEVVLSKHASLQMLSWWNAEKAEDTAAFLASNSLRAIALSCLGKLEWNHIGNNLTQLSISNVDMPASQWSCFFRHLGHHASLRDFALCKVKSLTIHPLLDFIQYHRQPEVLDAFGLANIPFFTYDHLMALCAQMNARNIKLYKWTLKNCSGLQFHASAQEFIRTFHTNKLISFDINTRTPLSLRKHREALWIEQVLTSNLRFFMLGLGGRNVLAQYPPTTFQHVEQLCLESAEINWGFHACMTRLRAVSLYSVESSYFQHEELLGQLLKLPNLSHVRCDYCRFEECVEIPLAKHLVALDLSWCAIENQFRNSFFHALVRKKLPTLSNLGLINASPSFVCLLVLALRDGHRNCTVDARGHMWTVSQLKFLRVSLRQISLGDLSTLRISVHEDARAEMQLLREAFPLVVL